MNCNITSIGKTPISDGVGLYASDNIHPRLDFGITQGLKVRKLGSDGSPSSTGKLVLLGCAGMSNARQEFGQFIKDAKAAIGQKSVTFYNGNRGSWDITRIYSSWVEYKDWLLTGLSRSNITTKQVQVLWVKNSVRGGGDLLGYLTPTIERLLDTFPNVKQVFLSSAIYSGYSTSPARKEPDAYNEGLAVRQFVLNELGNPNVYISWGPYLWADGVKPRKDGLSWVCSDFETDGVHPDGPAEAKVSKWLLDFFANSEATKMWFKRV